MLAKEPVAGRVKTRLCPPCTPEQAADLAAAALADTLEATLAVGADRVLLALDGEPGPWVPAGVTVVGQGRGSFDRRLAHSWSHASGPAVQIGMDTPQVTAELLATAAEALGRPDTDAVLGRADDGGWWAIGLRRADARVFMGVPTSRPDTADRQRARLFELGLRTRALPVLRDVDCFEDAVVVAAQAPSTRFSRALARLPVGVA